jgi:hypothetical protein
MIPQNTAVEMTGGEIGLIQNIDDIFKELYDNKKVKKIIALSNGLLRVRNVDWLDKVDYMEHLVFDIEGKNISKFYDIEFSPLGRTVVVTTKKTTESILNNVKYFKDLGLFTDKFFIKIMNQKTHDVSLYWNSLFDLFTILNDKYHIKMVNAFINSSDKIKTKRKMCMKNPPHCFIDFDTGELGHCAVMFQRSKRAMCSPENYKLLIRGELFESCEYCNECYNFDNGEDKIRYILNSKSGEYRNRSFKNGN